MGQRSKVISPLTRRPSGRLGGVWSRSDLRLMLRCRPRVGLGVLGRGMGSLSAPRRWPRLSWITWRTLRTHSCFSSSDEACAVGGGGI